VALPWLASSKLQSASELALARTIPADAAATPRTADEAVLALFDECAVSLRRYLGSFGLGSETSEDILQDVFLSLCRHLQLGRPRHNLKGWLFQVAHNLALKHRRRGFNAGHTEHPWDAGLPERAIDPGATPEDQLLERRRRRHLLAVVRAMPERDRQCLLLRAEGLCYRDIAATLGISLGSVAKSLTRSVTRLTMIDRG
jgi:RNA polymerase sigma-70 factor (ECF subfamily)